ncbi:MAG TPA: transporter, partial [Modicisalibacter sp.]|nr:transporter [Modicisalibacter sp.]
MQNQTIPPQNVLPDQIAHTKSIGDESLAPQQTRIMGRFSYLLAWFGG